MAHAEAVNKGLVKKKPMGNVQRIKDREMVKDLRYPGRMNAMVYAKEYGGNLDKL